MEWATLLVTFFKGSQALRDIYEKSVVLYYGLEERQDQNQQTEIQEEREAIVAALKQPGMTDVQKRALYKRLIHLSKL